MSIFDEYDKFNIDEKNLKAKGINKLTIIVEGLKDPILRIEELPYTGFERYEELIIGKDTILEFLRSL